jgi:predicted DNA-binding antitoxin AbrB/MazE fold protein
MKRIRCHWFAALLMLTYVTAAAAAEVPRLREGANVTVRLRSGGQISGTLVEQTKKQLTIKQGSGLIRVDVATIEEVEGDRAVEVVEETPAPFRTVVVTYEYSGWQKGRETTYVDLTRRRLATENNLKSEFAGQEGPVGAQRLIFDGEHFYGITRDGTAIEVKLPANDLLPAAFGSESASGEPVGERTILDRKCKEYRRANGSVFYWQGILMREEVKNALGERFNYAREAVELKLDSEIALEKLQLPEGTRIQTAEETFKQLEDSLAKLRKPSKKEEGKANAKTADAPMGDQAWQRASELVRTRLTGIEWKGESFSPKLSGRRSFSQRTLGSVSLYPDGLAFHPDGRIAISDGSGTSERMSLVFWSPDGLGEKVAPIRYAGKVDGAERDRLEREGAFWFFGGPLAFDRSGVPLFSLGNCSPNGLFRVRSIDPLEVEKVATLDSTEALQVPSFDPDAAYSTSWDGIYRYSLLGAGGAKRPPWFTVRGFDVILQGTLILSPSRVIADVMFQGEPATTVAMEFDREAKSLVLLGTEALGPMAVSWDGKRIIRHDAKTRTIREVTLDEAVAALPAAAPPVAAADKNGNTLRITAEAKPTYVFQQPILVNFRLHNQTSHMIVFHARALEPTESDEEIESAHELVVTRDGSPMDVHGHPAFGMGSARSEGHRIEPGHDLTLQLDLRKFIVRWTAGRYRATLTVSNLELEPGKRSEVASEPFEFEIR